VRATSKQIALYLVLATALGAACADVAPTEAPSPTVTPTADSSPANSDSFAQGDGLVEADSGPGVTPDEEDAQEPANDPPPGWPIYLTVTNVEPFEGDVLGDDQVQLTGTGFVGEMIVLFGGLVAPDVFILTPELAVVRTPAHPMGTVDIRVFTPDPLLGEPYVLEEHILEAGFAYTSALIVSEIEPSSGSLHGGDLATVTGVGFTSDAKFYVGGHEAIEQNLIDSNTLVGIIPAGSFGPADVAVTADGLSANLSDAYFYDQPPELEALSPLTGPAVGGSLVTLLGAGLSLEMDVAFGDELVAPLDVDTGGSWLEVLSPAGPPGALVSVSVSSAVGSFELEDAWNWQDTAADPYLLSCSHALPKSGPTLGGGALSISCTGLHYGATVSIGGVEAETLSVDVIAELVVVKIPPGEAGAATLGVESPFATVTLDAPYYYVAPSPLTITSISPELGPKTGGTSVTLSGTGFETGMSIRIGALPALSLTVLDGETAEVVTPAGSPGSAHVQAETQEHAATLEDAFTYTSEQLALSLISPPTAAQCGGTYLVVTGDGFDEETEIWIGDEPTEVIERVSAAEIHVRSPKLPSGPYDAEARRGEEVVVLPGALSTFDPRQGYSGTWGGPIDQTVNVTVRGKLKWGAVAGAFVLARDAQGETISGYTDEKGQVTLSEPWLKGPVDVTASADKFTSYSVMHYDATNLTIYIRPQGPPGSSTPVQYPPDAILSGQVLGLGKYTVPVPGKCLPSLYWDDCAACEPAQGCANAEYACVDLVEQGNRCLSPCETHNECAPGFVCAGVDDGVYCMPDPGELIARCGVSAKSPFYTDIQSPVEGGWVSVGGTYTFPSTRLAELAVVCFGGWRDLTGSFTPVVMGVRRNIVALSGVEMTGLDVQLSHPLKRTFRLQLMDPPTWPEPLKPIALTTSLDLGSDGAIPFTRPVIPQPDGTLHLPRQLASLEGNLGDATYFFYTTLRVDDPSYYPASYNLIQEVRSVVEDRLPKRSADGWELELANVDADLYAVWGTSVNDVIAVGRSGRIMRFLGTGWIEQPSGTDQDLYAIQGYALDDIWAAGSAGTLLHFDGLAWQQVEDAPNDDYRAMALAQDGRLWLAGEVRLRSRDSQGAWTIEGPPWLQDVYGLELGTNGTLVAVGAGGLIAVRDTAGTWSVIETPTSEDLRDATLDGTTGALVVVGDSGTVLEGTLEGVTLTAVDVPHDLLAIDADANFGTLLVVGEHGSALERSAGIWSKVTIPDYRSTAHDVIAFEGGGARAVGGTAFILGPFLRFPVLSGPYAIEDANGWALTWAWDGGYDAQYTSLTAYDEQGKDLWGFVVDGTQSSALIPNLMDYAGLPGLGSGTRRVDLTRARNENFDIDEYTSREFSIWKRSSWTTNRAYIQAPEL
jgi:hypothetical protein